MVRQPYSVAVPSTGGRLHPLVPEVSVPYKGNRRGRKDYWRRPRREVEPSLMGKSDANERNESSLSNCRVQPALSKKEGRVGFRNKEKALCIITTTPKL